MTDKGVQRLRFRAVADDATELRLRIRRLLLAGQRRDRRLRETDRHE